MDIPARALLLNARELITLELQAGPTLLYYSPHWTKVAIFATLMLWPSYLLIVYRHGRPGTDSWGLTEKAAVPTNVCDLRGLGITIGDR